MSHFDSQAGPVWRTAGRLIAPGIYEYRGEVHVHAEEVCAHFGVACTQENFDTLMQGVCEAAVEHGVPRVDVEAAD